MPVFAAFFVLFAMANSGLPGTSGFVGEFLVILGTIKVSFWYAFLAATTLIFGAAYTLWMVKRVIYGEVANDNVAALKDVNRARDRVPRAARRCGALAWASYPKPLADVMNPTIQELLRHVAQSKLHDEHRHLLALHAGPRDPRDRAGAARAVAAGGRPRSCATTTATSPTGSRSCRSWARRRSPLATIGRPTVVTFQGMFVADLMSQVLKVATLLTVAATLVYGRSYLEARGLLTGEFLCARALRHARA